MPSVGRTPGCLGTFPMSRQSPWDALRLDSGSRFRLLPDQNRQGTASLWLSSTAASSSLRPSFEVARPQRDPAESRRRLRRVLETQTRISGWIFRHRKTTRYRRKVQLFKLSHHQLSRADVAVCSTFCFSVCCEWTSVGERWTSATTQVRSRLTSGRHDRLPGVWRRQITEAVTVRENRQR